MSNDAKYAVVIGSMNCDLIFFQQRLPNKGETYLADSASVAPGGKGANQAVQMAKLGMKTYMVAKVGNDNFGDFLTGELVRYGVSTDFVKKGKGLTGVAAVNTLSDGVYHSTVAPGTNNEVTVEEIESLEKLIAGASVLVLQLEIPIPAVYSAIEIANKNGVYTVLNAAPAAPIDDEHMKMVDCLVVNESEATFYIGKTINSVESAVENYKTLLSRVKKTLIITVGAKGSVLFTSEGYIHFPSDTTIKAVDTTGSGDSYVGAYAMKKAMGETDEDACRYASIVSQFTVTAVGGQPAMPTAAEVGNSTMLNVEAGCFSA